MEKGKTRQEILNTALELFSVQGYEATSVSQIADAVGIRKASLYSHFTSKQEILDALIQRPWRSMKRIPSLRARTGMIRSLRRTSSI